MSETVGRIAQWPQQIEACRRAGLEVMTVAVDDLENVLVTLNASDVLSENAALRALLGESRREHANESQEQYCGALNPRYGYCTCGADDWNARIDAQLKTHVSR